jgi:ribosomal protein S18 acetylase RimI-like enzyme
MQIHFVDAAQLEQVRRVLNRAHYTYSDQGSEDMESLLAHGIAVLAQTAGQFWGFLGVRPEVRPETMPADAPTRAYVRSVALTRGHLPSRYLPDLVTPVLEALTARLGPVQMLCYGHQEWLLEGLKSAGFTEVDRIQFYELRRLPPAELLTPPSGPATIVPAGSQQLEALAKLDGETFPSLWHFGEKDMLEIFMRCRLQVALVDGEIAGYSVLCQNSKYETQLARLAVHPRWQQHGIGRQLLAECIAYASSAGFRQVVLNTQTSNFQSQRLYRAFGFEPVGETLPVMGRVIH